MNTQIEQATYSPEDNKLRIYPAERLDSELYDRLKAAGFNWAPKQELFVAPAWSPGREDLCLELADEIHQEGTTMAERAAEKAARLDSYRKNQITVSNAYVEAANKIAERFANGQPILIGHHSQHRAERDQEKLHASMMRAVKASEKANYWSWRAQGVERHGARIGDPRLHANRIKKLLAELRKWQGKITHHKRSLATLEKVKEAGKTKDELRDIVEELAGVRIPNHGALMFHEAWDMFENGEDPEKLLDIAIQIHKDAIEDGYSERWIRHILGRLSYERQMLGPVTRFDGNITAGVLQAFARNQGVDRPKASKEADQWSVFSAIGLPEHFPATNDDGDTRTMSDDGWRDFMQECGYEVPVRRAPTAQKKRAPLINPSYESAKILQAIWNETPDIFHSEPVEPAVLKSVEWKTLSKGTYSRGKIVDIGADGRILQKRWSGKEFKYPAEPVARVRMLNPANARSSVVVLADKPQKPLPQFEGTSDE